MIFVVRLSNSSLQYTLVVPELLSFDNLRENFGDSSCRGNGSGNNACIGVFLDLLAGAESPRT